jgi:hypothetical protein
MTGDAVDYGGRSHETRGDPVVSGLAQHDPSDHRSLVVDRGAQLRGEARVPQHQT